VRESTFAEWICGRRKGVYFAAKHDAYWRSLFHMATERQWTVSQTLAWIVRRFFGEAAK